jgi:hypothetical protein
MYGHRPRRTTESPDGASPTGSPPLSGCARPAWFPDGYRISVSPIVGPSTKPRGSGAPASKLGLPDSGGGLAHEGPTLRVQLLVRRRNSPPWRRGNHARDLRSRPPLLPRPLGHHTPLCGRNREVSRLTGLQVPPWGGDWLPTGRGRGDGRIPLYGSHPHRDRHPHLLGL